MKVPQILQTVHQVVAQGPYAATWESLKNHEVPQWYLDAKFGIFIHWGIYAVPAFGNEWYPRNMYIQNSPEFKHHVETYGPQSQFGYKDFVPQFRAEKFDPACWADLFRKAGAKYVVPVAEHHDGFAMYDCGLSEWTAARMGLRRDIVGELAAAVREQGLIFGLSSHRAEHWWFMNGGRAFDSDVQDPRYADFYGPATPTTTEWQSKDWQPRPNAQYLDDWLARTCELVDKYQPQLVWFDWWIEQTVFEPYLQQFAAFYYNRGEQWRDGVAINYKNQAFAEGSAILDIERGKLDRIRESFWQTDTSIGKKSWGYIEGEENKSVTELVHDLVDIVSKNGCLLLNVGPRSDGTISEEQERVLLGIGEWLKVNGEAIYGTTHWETFGEGPTQIVGGMFGESKSQPFTAEDIRFTRKGNALYATCLGWPEREANVKSLGTGSTIRADTIAQIHMLGSREALAWRQDEGGLTIQTPAERPCDHACVFKIVLKR
jgi:alpha-L-fucosidase